MELYDCPLFEVDKDDVFVMGRYKMHEAKKDAVIIMSSSFEYQKHISVTVVDTQLAIIRAAILSYI